MNKFLNCCLLTSLAVFGLTEMNIGNCTLVLEHTHDMSTEYVTDDEYHYYECSECGHKTNVEAHDYSDWIFVKEATKDDKDGIQTKTCSICKKVVSREYTYNNIDDYKDIVSRIGDDYSVTSSGIRLQNFKTMRDYIVDTYYNDNDVYFYGLFRDTRLGAIIEDGCIHQKLYLDFEGNEYSNGPVLYENIYIYDREIDNQEIEDDSEGQIIVGSYAYTLWIYAYFFSIDNPTGNLTYKYENLVIDSSLSVQKYAYKVSYYDGDNLIGEIFVKTDLDIAEDYLNQFIMLIDSNLILDESYINYNWYFE